MSTLELIQTQNEHKADTYLEGGEDTPPSLRERYEATPAPTITDPWEHIWKEVHGNERVNIGKHCN